VPQKVVAKVMPKKTVAKEIPKNNAADPFALEDGDEVATYGTEVVCRDAGDFGQGLFFMVDLPKGKKISVYIYACF
jgi:hypothetical protein